MSKINIKEFFVLFLILISYSFTARAELPNWYVPTGLESASLSDWKKASQNKRRSASLYMIVKTYYILDVDKASQLTECIDQAASGNGSQRLKVSEVGKLCMELLNLKPKTIVPAPEF